MIKRVFEGRPCIVQILNKYPPTCWVSFCHDICTFWCYCCIIKKISFQKYLSSSRYFRFNVNMLQPWIVGEEHYESAQRVKQTLQHYKELQDIIAVFGLDKLY